MLNAVETFKNTGVQKIDAAFRSKRWPDLRRFDKGGRAVLRQISALQKAGAAARTPTRRSTGWCACSTAAPTVVCRAPPGAHGGGGHRPREPRALRASPRCLRGPRAAIGSLRASSRAGEAVLYLRVAAKSNAV